MATSVESKPASESSASPALTLGLLGLVVLVGIVFAFSSSVLLPNNWYSLFKAIHVTFALVWVGGGVLLATLALLAERKADPEEVTIVARQAAFVGERIFAPAGLIVFVMGIAMMINTDLGWGKFWVIVGLVGYAATFATGLGLLSPLTKKIAASAAEHGPTAPETMALVRKTLLIARFDIALLLIVVLDMVTKPFA